MTVSFGRGVSRDKVTHWSIATDVGAAGVKNTVTDSPLLPSGGTLTVVNATAGHTATTAS